MSLIEVNNLSKNYKVNIKKKGIVGMIESLLVPGYKVIEAVKDITFSIERGDMVGFIGPNGAGKSTTVKMLTGILVPTSGEIMIGNLSPYKHRKKNAKRIGVVFGQRSQLWWDLPVYDTFDILKYVYEIPVSVFKNNMETFNDLLDLNSFIDQPVRQLSLGQKMRADIAASLLHDPEIVFFDEPTIGLDVVAKEKIREFIKHINATRETTMLFTTHDMKDIEKTCKKMIIIDKGSIIYFGTVTDIKERYGSKRLLICDFAQDYPHIELTGCEIMAQEGNKKWIQFDKNNTKTAVLVNELTRKYEVTDFMIQEPEIESIIRDIYQGGIGGYPA